MTIRLHTRSQNSAGERVRIALNLKNTPFEYVSIPSLGSNEYRSLNPQQLMPTLEIDGQVVSQSLAILELLEERFPTPRIFPIEPVARAQSRAFALAICSELHAVTVHRVRTYLRESYGLDNDAVARWYQDWTKETFGALEESLCSRKTPLPYCFADHPTVADIALVPQMSNARRFECELGRYPLLREIDQRCRRLSAFKNAAAENQPDFDGIR